MQIYFCKKNKGFKTDSNFCLVVTVSNSKHISKKTFYAFFFIFGRHKLVSVKKCVKAGILCTFPTQKIQMFLKLDSHINIFYQTFR